VSAALLADRRLGQAPSVPGLGVIPMIVIPVIVIPVIVIPVIVVPVIECADPGEPGFHPNPKSRSGFRFQLN
jgi:hypothetical protein